jgi:cytochrome c-type biogenesis protein CcsB
MELITFKSTIALLSLVTLLLATAFYWSELVSSKHHTFSAWSKAMMLISNTLITALLVMKCLDSGHLPFSNLYESLVCLNWSLTISHLTIQYNTKSAWLGVITAPSSMLIQAFANFGLAKDMQQSTVLIPALQSNWLTMHVSMMMLSYSTLLCGSLIAMITLIISHSYDFNANQFRISCKIQATNTSIYAYSDAIVPSLHLVQCLCFETRHHKLLHNLDYWSYRIIGLGFISLTFGILSGAIWANEAWGTYWSWDPKETWALITWITYAIYLHTRMTKRSVVINPALVASFGLCIIWACYLGVNLVGRGLHSYGWLN